jgi:hypothetical protein
VTNEDNILIHTHTHTQQSIHVFQILPPLAGEETHHRLQRLEIIPSSHVIDNIEVYTYTHTQQIACPHVCACVCVCVCMYVHTVDLFASLTYHHTHTIKHTYIHTHTHNTHSQSTAQKRPTQPQRYPISINSSCIMRAIPLKRKGREGQTIT